jgi:hypothetical protein
MPFYHILKAMEMIIKKIKAGLLAALIISSAFYSCDSTEKKREKNKDAIPTERYEEAKAPDSLTNNQVHSDNDGNDGTLNGSMPSNVSEPAPKKDN